MPSTIFHLPSTYLRPAAGHPSASMPQEALQSQASVHSTGPCRRTVGYAPEVPPWQERMLAAAAAEADMMLTFTVDAWQGTEVGCFDDIHSTTRS